MVVGAAGDGGGLLVPVAVTDDTPVCSRLRAAGLPAGLGLVAAAPIACGDAVVEYVGEILTREQAESREAWYAAREMRCSYSLFTEMHGFVIDATLYGNAARFMNASCEPNLKQVAMRHDESSLPRVIFRARRDIAEGEELTWAYGAEGVAAPAAANEDDAVRHSSTGSQRSNKRDRAASGSASGPLKPGYACYCGSARCKGVL